MELKHHEICIIKVLIDLNDMYFQDKDMKNPIRQQINDNLDIFEPFGFPMKDTKITQKCFSILKEKIDKRFEKENVRCIHCGESDGLSFEDERGFDITDNPYCFECSMYQDEG